MDLVVPLMILILLCNVCHARWLRSDLKYGWGTKFGANNRQEAALKLIVILFTDQIQGQVVEILVLSLPLCPP
jgi:hypothetical protein